MHLKNLEARCFELSRTSAEGRIRGELWNMLVHVDLQWSLQYAFWLLSFLCRFLCVHWSESISPRGQGFPEKCLVPASPAGYIRSRISTLWNLQGKWWRASLSSDCHGSPPLLIQTRIVVITDVCFKVPALCPYLDGRSSVILGQILSSDCHKDCQINKY